MVITPYGGVHALCDACYSSPSSLFVYAREHALVSIAALTRAAVVVLCVGFLILFKLIHSDKKLSIFAISPRLDSCLVDNVEGSAEAFDLLKDGIHLFEGAVGCLGEEKVDARNNKGIEDGEYDIRLPLDVGECDRSDHDNLVKEC